MERKRNNFLQTYPTSRWWCWHLFPLGIDPTMQNPWLLVRAGYPRWSLLEFRWYVLRCLLEINCTQCYYQEVAVPKRGIPKEVKLSKQQHLIDNDPLKKLRHYKACNLKLQMICTTCKFHLHVKCFSTYDTSQFSFWTHYY